MSEKYVLALSLMGLVLMTVVSCNKHFLWYKCFCL